MERKSPNLSYFHMFGCICYILNDKDQLGKFDEGIFLDYSINIMSYRVYNKMTHFLGDAANVVFDDQNSLLLLLVEPSKDENVDVNDGSEIKYVSSDDDIAKKDT